jgi:uncharacterized protein (TIGR04255 family)
MSLINASAPEGVFARPPIELVVCQVQFEPILRIGDASSVAPFQEAVRDQYPSVNQVAGIQLSFGEEGLTAQPLAQRVAWAFVSQDENWQVVLAQSALTVQAKHPASYETVRERFLSLVRTFVDLYQPGGRTRLGLRYINKITFDDAATVAAWRPLVRPEVLGLAASDELFNDDEVLHSFGQTRVAQDESQMIIKYGFLEPGTLTHPDVAPSTSPYLVIDLDQFDVRRMPTVDPAAIQGELDGYHEDIHCAFRWVLTSAGAERLGLGQHGAGAANPNDQVVTA